MAIDDLGCGCKTVHALGTYTVCASEIEIKKTDRVNPWQCLLVTKLLINASEEEKGKMG